MRTAGNVCRLNPLPRSILHWARRSKEVQSRFTILKAFTGDDTPSLGVLLSGEEQPLWGQLKGRYIAATVAIGLFAFGSYTSGILQLLRCVRISGENRLFIAADVVCFAPWQVCRACRTQR